MSSWTSPSQELEAYLEDLLVQYPVEKRRMFGCPVFFFQKNMFCGVFRDQIFLRFSNEDIKSLLSEYDEISHFEPLKGKKMKQYLSFPETVYSDIPAFQQLLEKSFSYMLTLKPKP